MIPILKVSDFQQKEVQELIFRRNLENKEANLTVEGILEDVRRSGDEALIKYTQRFDKAKLSRSDLAVKREETEEAFQKVSKEFIDAIELAKERIFYYHQKQKRRRLTFARRGGIMLEVTRPLERVGAYVPGGRASYPTTVLMNVIPAQVAGVTEVALCVPPSPDGKVNAATLVAASMVGASEIYKVGGAQAIAALAYGTETIKRVDKITGPGNIYVTLAKKQVLGEVGIDMLAGPSEVVILADEFANPAFIGADMLAQAEHDPLATALLITTSSQLAEAVKAELKKQLSSLKRKDIAGESLKNKGKILICDTLDVALELANLIAPEHLEIMARKAGSAREVAEKVRNAGAIFLGDWTPEVIGDYVAGPNHILPTEGTARFSSPLGVEDFLKRSHVIFYSKKDLEKVAEAVSVLAETEGLEAHGKSCEIRLEDRGDEEK